MQDHVREMMLEGLTKLGLEPDDDQTSRLVRWHDLLMERTRLVNLTGHRDEATSVVHNVLNALGPWRQIHPTKATCDIGSGGGTPGIPLAIVLGMPRMTLIESKQKKAAFLREACAAAAPQVRVICSDARLIRERFVQVTCTGFGTLGKILGVTRQLLATGGRVLAYKGTKAKLLAEVEESGAPQAWTVVPFSVPGLPDGTERHLCIFTAAGDGLRDPGRKRP